VSKKDYTINPIFSDKKLNIVKPRNLFFNVLLASLFILNTSLANSLNSTSWDEGGKKLLLIGESTAFYEEFMDRHISINQLFIPTSSLIFNKSRGMIEAEVLTADALFLDESQLESTKDFAEHPYIKAALKYTKPIVVQNATAAGISSVAGVGFSAPIVIIHPIDKKNTQLSVIHAKEEGVMPTLEEIQKEIDKAQVAIAQDESIMPSFARKRVNVNINLPVDKSAYIGNNCKDEKPLEYTNKFQNIQLNVGLEIFIYAFNSAKYVKVKSSGTGINIGPFIRDDSKFKGFYVDQAQFTISTNNSNLTIVEHAPENSNEGEVVKTTTSFGIASGPKGFPIPTFDNTNRKTKTLKNFGIVSNPTKRQASWTYNMQTTQNGDTYNGDPVNLVKRFLGGLQATGIKKLPLWASSNMPVEFETIGKVPAGYLGTVNFSFFRTYRTSAIHIYSHGTEEYYCPRQVTNPYTDNFSIDFSTIQAFDEAQPVLSNLDSKYQYTDITTNSIKGWYTPQKLIKGWAPSIIKYTNFADDKSYTSSGLKNWTRTDISLDGDLYAIDDEGSLYQLKYELIKNSLQLLSTVKLDTSTTKVIDVAAGPDLNIYYTTKKGIISIDESSKQDTVSNSLNYNRLAVTASGNIYATRIGNGDKSVHEFNLETGKWKSTGETAIDITTAGNYVIGIKSDGAVILYDPNTKEWSTVNSMNDEVQKYKEKIVAIDAGGSGTDFVFVATTNKVFRIYYRH
jgi:hypothetical protein